MIPGRDLLQQTLGSGYPLERDLGRRLYYLSADRRLIATDVVPGRTFGVGARRPLFDASGFGTENFQKSYDVGPDGRFFFLAPLGATSANAPSRVVWADNRMSGLPIAR